MSPAPAPAAEQSLFLTLLPREIRNEVYNYLLLFDTPKIHPPNNKREYLCHIPRVSLDLTILQVNGQIHDEAAEVLYGFNIFPIRISIFGSLQMAIRRTERKSLKVNYQSLWEEVGYEYFGESASSSLYPSFKEFVGGRRSCFPSNGTWKWRNVGFGTEPPFKRVSSNDAGAGAGEDDDVPLFPAPRYRHLIRQVQMAIFDHRTEVYSPMSAPNESIEDLRRQSRMILMTAVHRLRNSIGGGRVVVEEKGGARVGVKTPTDAHIDVILYPDLRNDKSAVHPAAPIDKITTTLHGKVLRELGCTIWPLTVNGWRYSFRLVHPVESVVKRFLKVKDVMLRVCDEDDGFSEEEEEKFRKLELGAGTAWAIKDKKLILVTRLDGNGVVNPYDDGPGMICCFSR